MTLEANSTDLHPAVKMYTEEFKAGKMDRREFLTRATTFGITAAAAYGLIGEVPAARRPVMPCRRWAARSAAR